MEVDVPKDVYCQNLKLTPCQQSETNEPECGRARRPKTPLLRSPRRLALTRISDFKPPSHLPPEPKRSGGANPPPWGDPGSLPPPGPPRPGPGGPTPSPSPPSSPLPRLPPASATLEPAPSASSPSSPSPSPSPSSPTDVSFVAPPSSASPEPAPKSRSRKPSSKAKAKPAARSPPLASPRPVSPLSAGAPAAAAAAVVSSVGGLRSAAASQMEALRHRLDGLHSRVHTDLDASLSRASKRFKTQNQACQQLTDEVDNEYRKISDNLKENAEKLKAKYKQIMAETQSSTSRACKVTIPEITKSVEKAIDGLRSRYNISMPV